MTPILLAERPTSLVPAPIEDATRREFITGVGAAALAAAFLAACGEDEGDATPEAATHTIETPMGPVEIPTRPERIVVTDTFTLQVLDELDAPMVAAATLEEGRRVNVSQRAMDLPSIGTWETDLEAVIAAEPDLIVGITGWSEEIYEQLSGIAPTVLVDYVAENWRARYLSMAEPSGLVDAAQTKLTEIDPRVAELRSAIERQWPNGVTVSWLRVSPDSVFSYTSLLKNVTSIGLLDELGVRFSADALVDAEQEGGVDLGMERLRDADADVILYIAGGLNTDAPDVEAFASNPLWTSLSAVQAGRAYAVDPTIWLESADVEGANLVLDDLFEYLVN